MYCQLDAIGGVIPDGDQSVCLRSGSGAATVGGAEAISDPFRARRPWLAAPMGAIDQVVVAARSAPGPASGVVGHRVGGRFRFRDVANLLAANVAPVSFGYRL